MDLKGRIQFAAVQALNSANVPSELKQHARIHPNFQKMMQNLYAQLLNVETLRIKQGKRRLQKETVDGLVRDFVHTLLLKIENESNRRVESDLQRIMRERELQRQKDLQQSAESGKFVGDFAELQEGLKSEDIPSDNQAKETL